MILATTTVENVDRFLDVFGTKVADKRARYGSRGSTVFRDPTEENRIWALFDWDEAGGAKFVSDPEVPPILKEAGHLGKPQAAGLLGSYAQLKRSFYIWFFQLPIAEGVVSADDLAFIYAG